MGGVFLSILCSYGSIECFNALEVGSDVFLLRFVAALFFNFHGWKGNNAG